MPRIALLQSKTFSSKTEAFDHHETLIREAAAKGANIVVTQELFLTPYFCTVQDPARLGWEPIVKVEHYHVGAEKILAAENKND